ncbi:MAG: hypothetical protein KJ896_04300, partial [Nanoarchaeota archaeon]|nr:hypothetical protein [Nanoarchaeota archaeon]
FKMRINRKRLVDVSLFLVTIIWSGLLIINSLDPEVCFRPLESIMTIFLLYFQAFWFYTKQKI